MRFFTALACVVLLAVVAVQADDRNPWVKQANMPFARSDFTLVTVNREVYLLGGCDASQPLIGGCAEITNRFTKYNIANNQWVVLENAPNNRTRYNAVASASGDKIYYVGGRSNVNDTVVRAVDVYTIATSTWASIDVLGDAHVSSDGAAWEYNNFIYVTGGYSEDYNHTLASTASADLSNLAAGFTTSVVAAAPFGSGDIGLVGPINGKVYVMGGFSSDFCEPLTNFTSYDIASNTWTELAGLRHGRADMGYTNIGNKIYAAGGETKTSACLQNATYTKSVPVNEVEVYDLDNSALGWQELSSLAIVRMRFATTSDNTTNVLVSLGGQGQQTGTSSDNINDPANLDGYYPILNDVYSLNLDSVNPTVGAASATIASSIAAVIAVVAAILA